jgi:hypothetical protein
MTIVLEPREENEKESKERASGKKVNGKRHKNNIKITDLKFIAFV